MILVELSHSESRLLNVMLLGCFVSGIEKQEFGDRSLGTRVWGKEFGDKSLRTRVWGQEFGDRRLGTEVWGQEFGDRSLGKGV